MAIVIQAEPRGGRDIVHDALSRRLHRAQHLPPLIGMPQTGAPLPAYVVDSDAALLADPVTAAKMVGWAYPIVGGASPGLAHLVLQPSGLQFSGISHGPLVSRLMDAAVLAEDTLDIRPEPYEPRLLSIPRLRIVALWLSNAGGQNLFVFLEDGLGRGGMPLQIERSIQPRAGAALTAFRRRIAAKRAVVPAARKRWKRAGAPLSIAIPAIATIIVAFGNQFIDWLSPTPFRAWLIDLALVAFLFAAMGASFKGYWFGILVDGRNKISLSRLQIVLWTILFVPTFLVFFLWNGAHPPLVSNSDSSTTAVDLAKALDLTVPETVWLLMGMAGLSAAAVPAILSAKPTPDPATSPPRTPNDATKFLDGIVVKRRDGEKPRWSDIVLGDEAGNADAIDISKVQQLLFSVVAVVAYGYLIAQTAMAAQGYIPTLPHMSNGFLALIGASHATYLAYKGVSHTD